MEAHLHKQGVSQENHHNEEALELVFFIWQGSALFFPLEVEIVPIDEPPQAEGVDQKVWEYSQNRIYFAARDLKVGSQEISSRSEGEHKKADYPQYDPGKHWLLALTVNVAIVYDDGNPKQQTDDWVGNL